MNEILILRIYMAYYNNNQLVYKYLNTIDSIIF